MKPQVWLSLVAGVALLPACTQNPPAERPAAVSPAATVVGEAESCINISQINQTRIRDDWTIDFYGAGNRVWRNTLPNRCTGLRAEDAFSYETSLSQLCSTDVVYPLRQIGGALERGPGCGLAKFVPVKLAK